MIATKTVLPIKRPKDFNHWVRYIRIQIVKSKQSHERISGKH